MTRHYGDAALCRAPPHGSCAARWHVLVDNPISVAPGFQMENVFTFAGIPGWRRACSSR